MAQIVKIRLQCGDLGLIPGLGRSRGEENGYSLQYSCLENPHGQRSLTGYSPRGCKELDTIEQLSTAQHNDLCFLKFILLSILDLQYCINLCCMAK